MRLTIQRRRLGAAAAVVLAAVVATYAQSSAPAPVASKEWPTYGHDPGGMRFSPLTQITPANVGQLQVAWVYHMKPRRPRCAPRRRRAGPRAAARRPGFRSSEVTPLVIDGVDVHRRRRTTASSARRSDDRQGDLELSRCRPAIRRRAASNTGPATRQTPPQIVFGSSDGKLYSLDAKTGKPNEAFGDNGIVNLNTPEILQGLPGSNGLSSPPIVYKNLVITGGRTQENPPQGPGRRRARVGHAHRQAGLDVPLDSARRREVQRHLGRRQLEEPLRRERLGLHHGRRAARHRLHAVRRAVGRSVRRRSRRRQSVRHQPRRGRREHRQVPLALPGRPPRHLGRRPGRRAGADRRQAGRPDDSRRRGRSTRSGLLFLLDRVTGKPIYGVEERPVPQSEVPLERTSKTQPFPLKPPPLSRMTMTRGGHRDRHAGARSGVQEADRGRAAGRPVSAGVATTACACSSPAITAA